MRGPGASGDKGRLSGMNEKYPHRFIRLHVQFPVSSDGSWCGCTVWGRCGAFGIQRLAKGSGSLGTDVYDLVLLPILSLHSELLRFEQAASCSC